MIAFDEELNSTYFGTSTFCKILYKIFFRKTNDDPPVYRSEKNLKTTTLMPLLTSSQFLYQKHLIHFNSQEKVNEENCYVLPFFK